MRERDLSAGPALEGGAARERDLAAGLIIENKTGGIGPAKRQKNKQKNG